MDRLTNSWADTLIAQLVKSGVRHFFIAPGSRSTPLVSAASEHPLAETYVHYDERGLGFYALGHAKVNTRPAAVIVTSGSALAHLLPAVMEAFASRIPLILLTADRPPELLDSGENQTCDQSHFFGGYVRKYFSLPPQDETTSLSLVTSIGTHAVSASLSPEAGPVHINCMFREPFLSDKPLDIPLPYKNHLSGSSILSDEEIDSIALRLSLYTSGIILAGNYSDPRINEYISTLARRMHWPVVSCISSPYRCGKKGKQHVQYSDMMSDTLPFDSVECVMQIGDRFLSKQIAKKLHNRNIKEWILLSETHHRRDQGHAITLQISADPLNTIQRLTQAAYTHTDPDRILQWTHQNRKMTHMFQEFFEKGNTFSEYHIFHELSLKESYRGTFFFGNSLTVRNADAFFYPCYETLAYTSRGVSGIDGHVATAAGIALAQKKPLIAIMGDQTFLHDINSLPLLSQCKVPILLLVVNNGGGKIFSFLPIKQTESLHTPYFYNPHSYQLHEAAPIFGINSVQITTFLEFQHALDSFVADPKTVVVEVCINTRCITEEKRTLHELFTKEHVSSPS